MSGCHEATSRSTSRRVTSDSVVRSSIAVSLLRRAGIDDVLHVASGGVDDLPRFGIELDGA